MAFASGLNRPSARESAPGPRFVFFAVLSVVLMYFDQRDGWSEKLRYGLQGIAYPIQVAVGSPRKLLDSISDWSRARESLQTQNADLLERERALSLKAQRLESLEQENARLRELRTAMPTFIERSVLAEVVKADLSRQRQRLVLDQGDRNGVFRSQTVLNSAGLMGQISRVGPFSSEVMLITDPDHALPVQILRNGLRTIAVGSGLTDELELPYLQGNADVVQGDKLVTSGLGGIFPAGLPVGEILRFNRDPDQLLASGTARPAANFEQDREVLIVWIDPKHPAAPADQALAEQLPALSVAQPVVSAATATPAPTAPSPPATTAVP